jgi:hypothetical protein
LPADAPDDHAVVAAREAFDLTASDSRQGDGARGWLAVPDARIDAGGAIRPAQIAYLAPTVPDSLILQYVDAEDAP